MPSPLSIAEGGAFIRPGRVKDLSRSLIELASRPCGTNVMDVCSRLAIAHSLALNRLHNHIRRGLLHSAEPITHSRLGAIVKQYFVHAEHRDAWLATPVELRENLGFRRKSGPTHITPVVRRAQAPVYVPTPRRSYARSHGVDVRYQLTPEEAAQVRGPFSSVPVGYDPSTGRPWRS